MLNLKDVFFLHVPTALSLVSEKAKTVQEVLFFCSQAVGSCNLVLLVRLLRWIEKICTKFSNWGDFHCASDTDET